MMVDVWLKLQLKFCFINLSEDIASSGIMRKRIDRYLRCIIVFLFISIYLKNQVSRLLANRERFSSLRFLIYIHNNHNSASGCIHTCTSYYIMNGNFVNLAIFWRCTISRALENFWGNSVRAFSHICDSRLHRDTTKSQRAHALFRREAHYIRHDRSTCSDNTKWDHFANRAR